MERSAIEEMFRIEDQHWWFQGKRRIVLDTLDRLLPTAPDGPIVDLGCGTGRTLNELRTRRMATGVDPDPHCLRFCRERGIPSLVRSFGNDMPFASSSLGAVTALDILEHLEDDLGCAREIHRILAPEGLLLASVPAYRFLWSPHDDVLHHLRRYTRRAFVSVLERAGFHIERLFAFNYLLFPPIAAVRLVRRLLPVKRDSTDFFLLPKPMNATLRALFEIERCINRVVSVPVGVTWMAVGRKRG